MEHQLVVVVQINVQEEHIVLLDHQVVQNVAQEHIVEQKQEVVQHVEQESGVIKNQQDVAI